MSKKKINYIITDNNITVNYDGQTHIVSRQDALADELINALRLQKMEDIPNLISVSKRVENFSQGNFVVRDGIILVNGVEAPPVLGNKIVKFANEGLPYQPLVKFAVNLQANPSFRAVNELFTFLEKNDHPITENGNFIAYKKVGRDFKDLRSHTIDNSPGAEPSMPRNQVNEDSSQTCSHGLHVANWSYAHDHYGSLDDIMLEVEVNPADVVSIPIDYNNSKMRVCKYKVLGVVDQEHSSDVSLRRTTTDDIEVDIDVDEEESDEELCETCCAPLYQYEIDAGTGICDDCTDDEDDEDYPFEDDFQR